MSEQPTLADQREREAMQKVHAVYKAARELMATGMIEPIGYRVLVKLIEVTKLLEPAQAEEFPTLAGKDFEAKSNKQATVEQKGENHGIVMGLGPIAFERHGGKEYWCDVGDTIIINPYAGHTCEHPPGSGVMYQVLNDEDCFARIK